MLFTAVARRRSFSSRRRSATAPTKLIPSRAIVAGAAIALLGISFVGAVADRRLEEKDLRLATAVNNMSQGVVMFDANERLVVCNDRYMEMYGLSPEVLKPGCMLGDVIRHRIATGSLDRDAQEYRAELIDAMKQGKTSSWI